jgi:DNA-directed RNA polymerase subunit RPC12/RpoP
MSSYICPTCSHEVEGFHDCKKIIKQEVKNCGCKIITKEGFANLYSVYIEKFEYTITCDKHK